MENEEGQKIVMRFFTALDALIEAGELRGRQTFTKEYGINRRHLWMLRQDPSRRIMQLSWLSYLVKDYGVSARWLLTGRGVMMEATK